MAFPFIGQAYEAISASISAQRCVNLYLEIGPDVAPALIGTPGKRLLATIGSGPIRGGRVIGDYLYVVSGSDVHKVASDYSSAVLGSIGTTTGPVSMKDNGATMLIVDGFSGTLVTLATDVVTAVPDPDFPPHPTMCATLDVYFLVMDADTQDFYLSEDGIVWDALDFAQAEGAPDNIRAILVDHREAVLAGVSTFEFWSNTGNADFPLERVPGAFIETGIAAPFSLAKADNSLFWLTQDENGDGLVYRAQGYVGSRISTHAIEEQIRGYGTISDAVGWTYQQGGHTFYCLTFPSANKTWVYDIAASVAADQHLWHERAWMDGNGQLHRDRANCHMLFNRTHVVGDHANGKLYALDPEYFTDAGDLIKALRSCETIDDTDTLNRITHNYLQVDLQPGVGLEAGQGSNPQMMMRASDDGGMTWGNEHWAGLGAIGRYKTRAIWRRLGSSRKRVYEVSITDPVKRVITGAALKARGNAS